MIDHLDLFSLRLARRGNKTLYLSRGNGWLSTRLIALMKLSGWRFEEVLSPYEMRNAPGAYADLSAEVLRVALDVMESAVDSRLEKAGYADGLERDRLARYATLSQFKPLKRAVECVRTATSGPQGDAEPVLWLQKNAAAEAAAKYFSESGIEIRTYRAPLRLRMPARPGYLEHESDRWPGEAALRDVLKLFGMMGLIAWALVKGIFVKSADPVPADMLAMTGRRDPSAQLDDLFWTDRLSEKTDARISILHTNNPPASCRDYYADRTDAILSLQHILSGRDGIGGIWNSIRCKQLLTILRGLGTVLSCRLPLWLSLRIAVLNERAAIFEALIQTTGARLVWSMQEGHDPNTQALAVAAARTDTIALGTSWSLKHNPCLASANNRNDVMFVWGTRHREVFAASSAVVEKFVVAGYPVAASITLPDDERRLCFYDNVAGHDTVVGPAEMATAYHAVLGAAQAVPGWRLIIKGKRDEYRRLGSDIAAQIDRLIENGTVEFRDLPGDLATGLASDIVIGVGAATLPMVAAQYGVRCVLYDPEGVVHRIPFRDIPGLSSASDRGAFENLLKQAMTEFQPGTAAAGDIDKFADGAGAERCAAYMAALLTAKHEGADRQTAIAAADRRFEESWGRNTAAA